MVLLRTIGAREVRMNARSGRWRVPTELALTSSSVQINVAPGFSILTSSRRRYRARVSGYLSASTSTLGWIAHLHLVLTSMELLARASKVNGALG